MMKCNKKHKVLVFPCGSEIGLEIFNSLQFAKDFKVIGASSVKDHGVFNYREVVYLPDISDKKFLDSLTKVLIKNKIDFIFPAHDTVVYSLAKNRHQISPKVVGSCFETVEICRFKSKTYKYFKDFISVPKVYAHNKVEKFPVFLKPDAGYGSKGVALAKNSEELDFYLKQSSYDILVLEYLPGKEFTVDCFTDRKGNLLFARGRLRNKIVNGISVNTMPDTEFNDEIQRIAGTINSKINFKGAWFFQLKMNKDGILTLLEIAPRIAGSMALFRNYGVNFSLLSLYDLLDHDIKIKTQNFHLELDRSLSNKFLSNLYYENVYVDLDDCLIINNKVNTQLMKFLFQCLNDEKNIYLITRHRGDLKRTLEQFRIGNIFTSIILVENNVQKSQFINEQNSIFIDDSFSERNEVHLSKRIPVFAPDAIECLIK